MSEPTGFPRASELLPESAEEKQRIRELARRRLFGGHRSPRLGERYELQALIGRGGLGRVYRARDERLRRDVAIKFVRAPAGAVDPQQLFREALALARLSHPNIVPVHDVGRDGEEVFIVMELVEGVTLDEWASRRDWSECLPVFRQLAAALHAAHDAGLVHGDLKPSNVMIDGAGRALLLDFGLSRERAAEDDEASDDACTPPTRIGGTVGYMPPEQYRGELEPRSDQFAFCVTFFRVLFGRAPFEASAGGIDPAALRTQPAQRSAGARVPRWLRATILRGLAPEPQQRFAAMAELAQQLVPPRRQGAVLLGGAAIAIAVGAAYAGASSPGGCDAADPLAEAWSADRRDRLVARSPAQLDAAALERSLTEFSEGWQRQWSASCEAHRTAAIGDVMHDLRIACLRTAQRRVAYLLDEVEQPGFAQWSLAREAFAGIAPPACEDDEALRAGRPAIDIDWGPAYELDAGIAEANVELLLGDPNARLEKLLALDRQYAATTAHHATTLYLAQNLGAALNEAGRSAEAETRLRAALLEAIRFGRWPEVEGPILLHLAEAVARDPARASEALTLAEIAVATVETTPRNATQRPAAQRALAFALLRADRAADALVAIEASLHADAPRTPQSLANALELRGAILERLGRAEEAETSYRDGLAALAPVEFPTQVEAHLRNNLGGLLGRAGRTDAAIEQLRAAVSVKDRMRLGHEAAGSEMNIGNLELRGGRPHLAITAYDGALARLATHEEPATEALVRYNRAIACAEAGRHEEALAEWNRVIALAERTPPVRAAQLYPALIGKGNAALALGMPDEAHAAYLRALEREPHDADEDDRDELRRGLTASSTSRRAGR